MHAPLVSISVRSLLDLSVSVYVSVCLSFLNSFVASVRISHVEHLPTL